MYIHLVKKGENLQGIARAVGVEADQIAQVNGLETDVLLPGTTLLVPTQVPTLLETYTIKERDTLRKIANQFHIPEKILLAANQTLARESLPVGRVLTIPLPVLQKKQIEVNLRLEVQGEYEELATLDDAVDHISSLSIAAALAAEDGTLRMPPLYESRKTAVQGSEPAFSAQESAPARPVRLMLLVAPEDETAAERIVTYGPSRQEFFQQLRPWIAQDEFAGIHLEFTNLPVSARSAFTRFVRELALRVHQKRGKLYIAVPPHDNEERAYDIGLLQTFADRIVWNAEEAYGRVDGPPMALTPLHLVRRSLGYALTFIPREKLLLGLPFYGFDWPMPYKSDKLASLVLFGPEVDPDVVTELPQQIHWDDRAVTPMYTYRAEDGQLRQVWYEDQRSIAAKLCLVHDLGLAGVSVQVQGIAMPGYWPLLSDTFDIQSGD
ncbi:LysM peptidoglycan-binding domain-containing protein [Tumebacillus sp. ITR2]|uniref:LysM peptidoglycan-binding domain-containing protein n=1 Tax=Tumebacillus amylolyticus TaxID=2801339 RepID=A0ABS1JAL1_9BACL|nr:LysM peptidoglycan-binding domain-containing protein [Tumebacillus amylolyticus]MBL0387324.1 LysM peptidoglycan-binding domain-containing protein [Tumebacillus amylolyticus]